MKVIPIKIIKADHDTDWDGVSNRMDCEIFNPHRQDKWEPLRHRRYVRTRFYGPSKHKSHKERTKQIQKWRKKTKNEIAKKFFRSTFDNLSQSKKQQVNRIWLMQTRGV